jgi:hypothetical protein
MSTDYQVSLLRVTGANGEQAVAACVNGDAGGVLGVGDEEGWLGTCEDVPSVVLDCTEVIQLTNPKDVSALAAWLSAAAVWLQVQLLTKETP